MHPKSHLHQRAKIHSTDKMNTKHLLLVCLLLAAVPVYGASFYTACPDDPGAIRLSKESFPELKGDGVADDTAVIEAAINQVTQTALGKGVVLIPEGRYRLSHTLQIPPGVRLFGYGTNRPVLVLGASTPGFQEGERKYVVWFTGGRRRNFGGESGGSEIADANPGTFYSALANIDFEIQDGNPAAVCVRSHYAQHCYLAHIDFHIGSGRAGIEEVGNEAEDLRFHGGDYGILARKPSPSWPFALVDASFEDQRRAAIKCEEAGLTLIRNQFRNVPTAIEINENRAEELWLKDSRLENISGPALIISDEKNARTEISLENVVCRQVPILAQFRESGRQIAGTGGLYRIKSFIHGLHIADLGEIPVVKETCETEALKSMPPLPPSDIPALPPVETWAGIKSFGAKGDGTNDDTEAFKAAIAQQRVIFLPKGRYNITDTLELKPDTILIGLNPITTQISLADGTRTFTDLGSFKPMIQAPKGGSNIIVGIGLDSGANNTRAVALKWMAGKDSLVDDVRFLGGHGTFYPDGTRVQPYNSNRSGDPDPNRRWDSEGYSLWVTDGGGGTFANIWTPSTYAQAGICVSDTATEGRIYALSSEHHVRNEMIFRNVSNWQIDACQMEEERAESPNCLPVSISDCRNLSFANLYLYRIGSIEAPFRSAVVLDGACADLQFHNIHVYGPGKLNFDNALFDRTFDAEVRSREIAWLKVSGHAPKPRRSPSSPVLASGAKIEKLVSGFNDIESAAVDPSGNVYFVDSRWNRIYRWSPENHALKIVTDRSPKPVQIAFDRAGNLMVVTASRAVYSFRPDGNEDELTALDPTSTAPRPGLTAILPVNRWRDGHDYAQANATPTPLQFLSPDGTTFIPAPQNFGRTNAAGRNRFGFEGTADLLRTYGLAPTSTAHRFYVANEFDQTTWSFTVNPDGSLSDPVKFCEEGEGGVAVDERGNVYVAAGNIFVYEPSGRQIGLIEVPERPTSLAFGGKDRQTLFITARSSLYAVRTRYPGR
jgi:sugar lactone lactonase YvrE